ncbi:copper homeostasis protein CutC [Frischella perrara]|jgi:Uncharacterized protein involved in copper resistance|uniref:copper homeostasis protein CutC n=1 Tax=Frischella perrara TaxID=1267021 RepID=UPI0023F4F942|nr:copper homeostasis protein CutC [Frischella perrara]MCT6875712.1 copper homeostasis protein CutC [Frischella perrara]
MKLEICCYSIDDVILAFNNGADRIEFCSGRSDGGLTPSYGDLLQLSQLNLPIPIHPIIRPRGGDFLYSQCEINTMLMDIELVRNLNYSGIVFGCLQANGHIDIKNIEKLLHAAQGLSVTFHRAFDVCHDPILALKQLNELGVNRLLTSGQQQDATKGIKLIEQLHKLTQSTLIMPGCGVRSSNIENFKAIGITEFHSSASLSYPSPMQYQNHNVTMSHNKNDEFLRYGIDPHEIQTMKALLN